MTRVTELFDLGVNQSGVDFVDVDVHTDVPVYIDPTALRHQTGPWAEACVVSIQTYFQELLAAIKSGDQVALQSLIYPLVEPNETHLGQSVGTSQGRSLGSKTKADDLIQSLSQSKAVQSGFLEDLEDTALLVEGIDKDIVSDITTCVIRRHLIQYTQSQCKVHSIQMEVQASSPMWDGGTKTWEERDVLLPRANNDKLLLVPKSIVRVKLTVDKGRYYRGYLRPYFEDEVLKNPKPGLTTVLKDKTVKVILGKLDEDLGTDKPSVVAHTEKHPQALQDYRAALEGEDVGPLSDDVLAAQIGAQVDDLREMLDEMLAIAPGKAGATLYHRSVKKLMSALFTTSLGNEQVEYAIHDGMKRIDITYDNVARSGFFHWVAVHHPAAMIVVECKNYGTEVSNPEFDQLAMRFSPVRGRVGILACRGFKKKTKALKRAKNVAQDANGFVIVLDDDDFVRLVDDFESAGLDFAARNEHTLLRERFGDLIS